MKLKKKNVDVLNIIHIYFQIINFIRTKAIKKPKTIIIMNMNKNNKRLVK
jgi:hypothetical protein